ncbi:hypothetical protein FLACOL_01576 [Flavobacterium columnare]|nr:hypothetical protein [Flavobacterium columnare]SPE77580.1 hypothetical protein FLACOL_01576 [Flavobacterium columnare]
MSKVFGEFAFQEDKEDEPVEEYSIEEEEVAMCICPECLEEFDAKKNIVEEEKSNKIQHIKKELLR